MGAFLSKHQFLIIWVCGLAIVGAFAVVIIQLNSSFLPTSLSLNQPTVATPWTPPTPPAPSVALTIQKDGNKNTLVVRWNNLPGTTAALNIFRGIGNDTSTYTLWQTIRINLGESNGNAQFTLGKDDLTYNYFVQAVNGGGGTQGNGTSTEVLWTSDPITPATSTPPGSGNNGNQNSGGGGSSTSTNSTSTNQNSTSTNQNPNNGTSTPTSTNGTGSNATHAGDPFYNPQIQITGYGTGNGSFWVRHAANQSVELGWQDLPVNTDDIIFYRSQNQGGPWGQFLEQRNPGTTGSYSLAIIDETLNEPYYYELVANQSNVSSATYGPIYLPPANQ